MSACHWARNWTPQFSWWLHASCHLCMMRVCMGEWFCDFKALWDLIKRNILIFGAIWLELYIILPCMSCSCHAMAIRSLELPVGWMHLGTAISFFWAFSGILEIGNHGRMLILDGVPTFECYFCCLFFVFFHCILFTVMFFSVSQNKWQEKKEQPFFIWSTHQRCDLLLKKCTPFTILY